MKNDKFAIIHISDVHMLTFDKQFEEKTKKLVEAVRQYKDINVLFIVISGDLVNSGSRSQFKNFQSFCEKLKELVSENKIIDKKNIHFAVSPGNHDIKYFNWFKRKRKNIPINSTEFNKNLKNHIISFEIITNIK